MSRRAVMSGCFASIAIWGFILGLAFASGPVLVLATLVALLFLWWSEPVRYQRYVTKSPEYRYERDRERLP